MHGTLCSWQYCLNIQSVKGASHVVLVVADAGTHQVTLFIFILIFKKQNMEQSSISTNVTIDFQKKMQ